MIEPQGSSGSAPLLGKLQRRLLATAIGALSVFVLAVLTLLVFFLLKEFVIYFSSVIWPLAVAGILALLLLPLVRFFEEKLKLSRVKAIALIYAMALLVGAAIVSFALPVLLQQALELADYLPKLAESIRQYLSEHLPTHLDFLREKLNEEAIREHLGQVFSGIRELAVFSFPAIKTFGLWVWSMFALVAGFAIIPVYLFYFLLNRRDLIEDINHQLSFLSSNLREDVLFLIREFTGSIVAFFRGQVLIALIMGVLMSVGFTLAGLKFGTILGLTAGLLNIVPYLGTIIGISSILPIAFFQSGGGWLLLLICLFIFIGVQMLEGYYLTPRIMGQQTGLHPLIIIIALFFWGTLLNGLLGMILAVPLTAFFVVAWRLLKRKYLDPLNEENASNTEKSEESGNASQPDAQEAT